MKKVRQLRKHFDTSIKVGDKVKLRDGSGLSVKDKDDMYVVIICSYHTLTGSLQPLKDLTATVIEVGLEDTVSITDHSAYIQDIIIDINGCKFRTPSEFVYNVETF